MAKKPARKPSFFMILINHDCTRQIMLPSAFTGKYRKLLPESTILRISSGETWQVRLERREDDQYYYFTRGWSKFVKDLELKIFEFLVFWFNIGDSTFDVSLYETSACEKDPKFSGHTNFHDVSGVKKKESRPRIVRNEAEFADGEMRPDNSKNPRFEIVLKKHHKSRVAIGKHFAESCGLIGEERIGVEYPGGRNAYVALDLRSLKKFRLDLAVGWFEFRKANGLTFGKKYSFEFVPSKKVIQVRETKGNK